MAKVVRGIGAERPEGQPVPESVAAPQATLLQEEDKPIIDVVGKILTDYIHAYCQEINTLNPLIVAARIPLHPARITPFASYIGFTEKLNIMVRPLTKPEFITAITQMNPELGSSLSETDLQNDLPDKINLYQKKDFSELMQTMGVYEQADEVRKISYASEKFKLISTLEMLSLFMETGAAFLEYLGSTAFQKYRSIMPQQRPLVTNYTALNKMGMDVTIFGEFFPPTSEVFSPDTLRAYVTTGSKDVKGFMEEYRQIENCAKGNSERLYTFLHTGLAKINTELFR